MFIAWYDPDRKKPTVAKLAEAAARYAAKWGRPATTALVNPADMPALANYSLPLNIRAVDHVAPSCFFVGEDEVTP